MPRELTYYQCEICGKVHSTLKSAIACEESHIHAVSVVGEVFKTSATVPAILTVKMSDGSAIQYKLMEVD